MEDFVLLNCLYKQLAVDSLKFGKESVAGLASQSFHLKGKKVFFFVSVGDTIKEHNWILVDSRINLVEMVSWVWKG